jgi:prepilin signal peptidase PulO-like enzyme (type II secretory pathway)
VRWQFVGGLVHKHPDVNPPLGKRLRSLFGTDDQAGLELVMTANGLAAVGVGILVALTLPVTFGGLCLAALVTFVLLTACLLSPYTVWIAAVLGSLTLAVTPAAALGLATEDLPGGHWGGAILGALLGLGAGFKIYWRLSKKAGRAT